MAAVAVTDHPFPNLAIARAVLEEDGHTVTEHACRTPDEVAEACADAEGVLNTYTAMPASALDALTRCRAIARFGIGVDTIDLTRAAERGIVVTNVPDYCTGEVATHTMALLLAVHRRVAELDRDVRDGGWDPFAVGPMRRLEGALLGLVGAGRIPRAVAARAAPFGLRIAAYDPYVPDDAWPAGIERAAELLDLAATADFLSVHAPSVPETFHLIGADVLGAMPAHAVLVNTARGALVDTAALVHALREGWIAGAGIDVVEDEPLPADHELRRLPTALVTPHAAFYSEASLQELQRKAAEQLRAALAGERPAYAVTP